MKYSVDLAAFSWQHAVVSLASVTTILSGAIAIKAGDLCAVTANTASCTSTVQDICATVGTIAVLVTGIFAHTSGSVVTKTETGDPDEVHR